MYSKSFFHSRPRAMIGVERQVKVLKSEVIT